jgi:hypothetical protein
MVRAALAPGSRLKLPHGAALHDLAAVLSRILMWVGHDDFGPPPVLRALSDRTPLKSAQELVTAIGPWRAAIAHYINFVLISILCGGGMELRLSMMPLPPSMPSPVRSLRLCHTSSLPDDGSTSLLGGTASLMLWSECSAWQ